MYEVLKGSHSFYLVTLTPEQPLRDLTTERQKSGYLGSAYGLTQCMLYSSSDPHKLGHLKQYPNIIQGTL